jgi:ribosomal protein L7/L12
VKASTDPELFNELLNRENKIMAMRVYRDKHGCTLAEARDAVELLLGKEDNNGQT